MGNPPCPLCQRHETLLRRVLSHKKVFWCRPCSSFFVDPFPDEASLSASYEVSAEEFQAAVTRLKDIGASDARVEAGQQEDHMHLWQYALGLMIAVLALEGLVASRTA